MNKNAFSVGIRKFRASKIVFKYRLNYVTIPIMNNYFVHKLNKSCILEKRKYQQQSNVLEKISG